MRKQKASVTVFLALSSLMFLTFCMVLIEGARNYCIRVKAAQAMELTEFSVLSEYQKELFEHYGVFFLDLDYEQGRESQPILEERAKTYLQVNAEETETTDVISGKFRRATDGHGQAFFDQAVKLMKLKSGYQLFETILGNVSDRTEQPIDLEKIIEEQQAAADSNLDDAVDEEGEPLFHISLPSITFPSVRSLRNAVFGSDAGLSHKAVERFERLSHRSLAKGVGGKRDTGAMQMQLFHSYLFKHFHHYGSTDSAMWTEGLEYQLEYIVAGKDSDLENLENVMWRIFLLRASGNYLFFHQDAEKLQKAEAQAVAIAGITGNAALIRAVRELILLKQAVEEGILETKRVFAGEKVPLYENGVFQGIQFGYKEYLGLFLNSTSQGNKVYRCMDLIELEVRERSGYERFRMDHCVDRLELQWEYCFESLFLSIPLMNGEIYETTITRKIYYET